MHIWGFFAAAALLSVGIASGAAVNDAVAQSAGKITLKITPLSDTVNVPLHWSARAVSCPETAYKECYTHTLRSWGKRDFTELRVRFKFTCPAGTKVRKLYYKRNGRNVAIARNLGTNSVVKTVNVRPWTAEDFLNQCRKRFDEPWAHSIPKGSGSLLKTSMQYDLEVRGECSGENPIDRAEVMKVHITCVTNYSRYPF